MYDEDDDVSFVGAIKKLEAFCKEDGVVFGGPLPNPAEEVQKKINELREKYRAKDGEIKSVKPGPEGVVLDRNPFHVALPPEILMAGKRLSHGAFRIWVALAYHARGTAQSWPGMKRLGEMAGIDQRNVGRYIRELRDVGLIEVHRKAREIGYGVYNVYTLLPVQVWWRKIGRKLKA
jgi:chromosome segregation and condensation protein ScpB